MWQSGFSSHIKPTSRNWSITRKHKKTFQSLDLSSNKSPAFSVNRCSDQRCPTVFPLSVQIYWMACLFQLCLPSFFFFFTSSAPFKGFTKCREILTRLHVKQYDNITSSKRGNCILLNFIMSSATAHLIKVLPVIHQGSFLGGFALIVLLTAVSHLIRSFSLRHTGTTPSSVQARPSPCLTVLGNTAEGAGSSQGVESVVKHLQIQSSS